MGEVMKEVRLHGFWSSGYCDMVHHGLNLKGVPYDYVEEDLQNKSESLLQLNPVYKKVPVLVVDGRPIAESQIILEYIDETWKDPPFLPQDPYKRSMVRFWANFINQKLGPASYAILFSQGEEKEKVVKEFLDHLRALEDAYQNEISNGGPFINGERPGLLDVVLSSCHGWLWVVGKLASVELLDKEHTPLICWCIAAFEGLEVVKDMLPDHDRLLERVRGMHPSLRA